MCWGNKNVVFSIFYNFQLLRRFRFDHGDVLIPYAFNCTELIFLLVKYIVEHFLFELDVVVWHTLGWTSGGLLGNVNKGLCGSWNCCWMLTNKNYTNVWNTIVFEERCSGSGEGNFYLSILWAHSLFFKFNIQQNTKCATY